MILVDSSVWIDYLRSEHAALARALDDGEVLMHPMVVGELACGHLEPRQPLLSLLQNLPKAAVASHEEVLGLIELHSLFGRGIGYVDAHLLASAMLGDNVVLWTRDRRLNELARNLELA